MRSGAVRQVSRLQVELTNLRHIMDQVRHALASRDTAYVGVVHFAARSS